MCGGVAFMASPRLGSLLLTFGQLKVDACPPETRNLTLLEEGEAVCGPKWAGGKLADDLLSDTTEGANCMCDQERAMLQFAAFFVGLVGYMYIQLARGNSLHFIAASTFNRLILVPVRVARLARRLLLVNIVWRTDRNRCACPPTLPCANLPMLFHGQGTFFIAWLLGARAELCLLFGLLDPCLTVLTLLSLNGSKLIPPYFRRVDETFRGVSFTTHDGQVPGSAEEAPGCFELLKISVVSEFEPAATVPVLSRLCACVTPHLASPFLTLRCCAVQCCACGAWRTTGPQSLTGDLQRARRRTRRKSLQRIDS
jgi:hypothetical protein